MGELLGTGAGFHEELRERPGISEILCERCEDGIALGAGAGDLNGIERVAPFPGEPVAASVVAVEVKAYEVLRAGKP